MKQIAALAVKNAQRHFIVWGALATIIMFVGMQENTSRSGHFDREPAKGTYAQVLNDNVCGDTVEGEFPTAAIVYNLHTGGYEFTTNQKMIGKALDEALGGKDWHGYRPQHFCK